MSCRINMYVFLTQNISCSDILMKYLCLITNTNECLSLLSDNSITNTNECFSLYSDKSVAESFQAVSSLIVFDQQPAQDGRCYLSSNLAYAEYWYSFWGGPSGKWGKC